MPALARYSKFIAAIVGAVAVAISEGVLTGTAAHWAAITIAVLTAVGVYTVKNAP